MVGCCKRSVELQEKETQESGCHNLKVKSLYRAEPGVSETVSNNRLTAGLYYNANDKINKQTTGLLYMKERMF